MLNITLNFKVLYNTTINRAPTGLAKVLDCNDVVYKG